AGADVVLVADPTDSDPALVREAAPNAILVALDATIEDAIERYDDVLADPAYMVIFEEADQAAQRAGWDAARWLRHLSAKLHRHDDVLPPGTERDEVFQPVPGPLRSPAPSIDFERAIAAFTDEAQKHADEVPCDQGLEIVPARAAAPEPGPAGAAPRVEVAEAGGDAAVAFEAGLATEGVDEAGALSLADVDGDAGDGSIGLEDAGMEAVGLEAADVEAPALDAASVDGVGSGAGESGSLDLDVLSFEPVASGESEGHAFDPVAFEAASLPGERPAMDAAAGIEDFLAERIQAESGPAPQAEPEATAGAGVFAGLSLADDAAPMPAATPSRADDAARPALDLDSLGSGLSLADPDSYGHGRLLGVVLIEAGIGGPDAVRQLLAAIPEGFPRPILVRMRLEGGRYDRLVRQMERATSLPVVVAEAGQHARPGQVHFVPPGMGVAAVAAKWAFEDAADFDPARTLLAEDSAVVFLSGAETAMVERVTGAAWAEGLVVAQVPDDGCYDPQAAQAAIAAGAASGTPAELAALLLDRWPAPGQPSETDPDGMLQP
ncbi:MAG: hypothetical protein KIS72_06910, partial [Luteimonas sp.]|nr:hypothetical protein [Luteimonas sp.]